MKKRRTAASKRASNGKARPNGRILTVKHLDLASYASIHQLPRGRRGVTMQILLKSLSKLPRQAVVEGRIAVVETV